MSGTCGHRGSLPRGRAGAGWCKATRARKLTTSEKEANRALATARAPVEHGFARLKNWWILTRLRTDPARATGLPRARFVLTYRFPESHMRRGTTPSCQR